MNRYLETDSLPSSDLFQTLEKNDFYKIIYHIDKSTGLKVIIGIHDITLGPSLGGVRILNYENESEALSDVIRLSRGMSYKSSISGLNLGGGKAVIIGDVNKIKTESFLRSFGKFVDSLGGEYITASDVNTNINDMVPISKETNHVVTLPRSLGGCGDPSIMTGYGTYLGIKAAVKKVYNTDSLKNKKILIQGVGKVGRYIVEYASKEGAYIYVSDISEESIGEVSKRFKVSVIDPYQVYESNVDIYCPCALGATINDLTINKLKCKIIAGAANNQLEQEIKHDKSLFEKGIVYVPDFVINAGGIIACYPEYLGKFNEKETFLEVEKIYDRCIEILNISEDRNLPPQLISLNMAKERILNKKKDRVLSDSTE